MMLIMRKTVDLRTPMDCEIRNFIHFNQVYGKVKTYEFEIFTVNSANHIVYFTSIHIKLAISTTMILSTLFHGDGYL